MTEKRRQEIKAEIRDLADDEKLMLKITLASSIAGIILLIVVHISNTPHFDTASTLVKCIMTANLLLCGTLYFISERTRRKLIKQLRAASKEKQED